MPAPLDPETRTKAERLIAGGLSPKVVAKRVGISERMARKIRRQLAEDGSGAATSGAAPSTAGPDKPADMPDAPPLVLGPAPTGCDMCASGCQGKCPGAWWEAWTARLVSMRANPFSTDRASVVFAGGGVSLKALGEWIEQGTEDLAAQRFETPAARLVVAWRAAQAEALQEATVAALSEMRTHAKANHAARALAIQIRTDYGRNAEPEVVGASSAAEGVRKMLAKVNRVLAEQKPVDEESA